MPCEVHCSAHTTVRGPVRAGTKRQTHMAHVWQNREILLETHVEAHQWYGLCSTGMILLVQSRGETTRCRERAVQIRSSSVRERDTHTPPERTRPSDVVRHYPHRRIQEIKQRYAPLGHDYILFGVHRALTSALRALISIMNHTGHVQPVGC